MTRYEAHCAWQHDENERPVLIIGKTVMGKGLVDEAGNSFEGKVINTRTACDTCRWLHLRSL